MTLCVNLAHTLTIVLIDVIMEVGPAIDEPVDQLVGIDRIREMGSGVPAG